MSTFDPFRRWLRYAALAVAAGVGPLFMSTGFAQEKDKAADIPVKRVVMFSSGVAFFEHDKVAFDLLTRRGAVSIVSETRLAGMGLELTGQVSVSEDKRDYRPQMVLADEGVFTRGLPLDPEHLPEHLKAAPATVNPRGRFVGGRNAARASSQTGLPPRWVVR